MGLDLFEGPKDTCPGCGTGKATSITPPVARFLIFIICVFDFFVRHLSMGGREGEIFSSFTTTRAVDFAVFVFDFVGVFILFLFSLSFSSFFGPMKLGREEELVEWVFWEEEMDEEDCVVDDVESLILKILLLFAKPVGAWAAVLVPKTATSGDDVWVFGLSLLSGVSCDPEESQCSSEVGLFLALMRFDLPFFPMM